MKPIQYSSREELISKAQQEVGPGWAFLIKDLIEDLFILGWNGEVVQIKEKFGGLRFYINGGTHELVERIDKASNQSERLCELCGAPGSLDCGGWMKALCPEHAALRKDDEKAYQDLWNQDWEKRRLT